MGRRPVIARRATSLYRMMKSGDRNGSVKAVFAIFAIHLMINFAFLS